LDGVYFSNESVRQLAAVLRFSCRSRNSNFSLLFLKLSRDLAFSIPLFFEWVNKK
jgi:hypothetical protein